MSRSRFDVTRARQGPFRRTLLRNAVCGLAATALPGAASVWAQVGSVQVKAVKGEAAYQPSPKNGLSCAVCSLFRPPRGCEVVAGDIDPRGWCRFFDLPD